VIDQERLRHALERAIAIMREYIPATAGDVIADAEDALRAVGSRAITEDVAETVSCEGCGETVPHEVARDRGWLYCREDALWVCPGCDDDDRQGMEDFIRVQIAKDPLGIRAGKSSLVFVDHETLMNTLPPSDSPPRGR